MRDHDPIEESIQRSAIGSKHLHVVVRDSGPQERAWTAQEKLLWLIALASAALTWWAW